MSEPNFKCPETGEEFYFSQYSTVIRSDKNVYLDKWRKVLVNPKNNVELVPIEKVVNWNEVNIYLGTGTDRSGVAKRQEQLKKRSSQHYQKEVKEQKYEKNKDLIKKYKGE
jgi:hypothetical protein